MPSSLNQETASPFPVDDARARELTESVSARIANQAAESLRVGANSLPSLARALLANAPSMRSLREGGFQ